MASYGLCKIRKNMKINKYISLVVLVLLIGCGESGIEDDVNSSLEQKQYNWRLVTAWPKNYPGLGMAPERIADLVEEMSNGQMKITVYGAGEQVPAFGVFDAVSSG